MSACLAYIANVIISTREVILVVENIIVAYNFFINILLINSLVFSSTKIVSFVCIFHVW